MTERDNKIRIQVPEIVGEGTFEGFVETDIEAPKDYPFWLITDVDFKVKVKDEKINHEWRNDLRTVLTTRPANLWFR